MASRGRRVDAGTEHLGPHICLLGYAHRSLRLISAGPLDPTIVVLEEPGLVPNGASTRAAPSSRPSAPFMPFR